jgi:sodium transport system permease protein
MSERDDLEAMRAPPAGTPPPSPLHSPPQGRQAAAGRLFRLMGKELNEVLRDRRTILTLIVMPLLLYPLLTLAFPQFLGGGGRPEEKLRIGVSEKPEGEELGPGDFVREDLRAGALTLRELVGREPPAPKAAAPGGSLLDRLTLHPVPDLDRAVREGQVDLGIRLPTTRPPPGKAHLDWELLYRPDSPHAREVLALVERLCVAANVRRLEPHPDVPRPPLIRLVRRPFQQGPARADDSLARLVPLVLILMTITGAVYPAIDLTAGERERGTLEILVAAPVPRLALLSAKYVAVLTVAVLTATINLTMMTVTLQVSGVLGQSQLLDLSPLALAQLFALLLLFAAFFSAVLLALTSFARSFKEAQAYLIPLMLVSLAPGILGMLPDVTLTGLNAVTPLLNVVLLGRDLLAGKAEAATAAVVVVSTLVYALAALTGAARIFGAESVLYSEQGAWSDLFRRPREGSPTATAPGALLCLALLFPAYYFLAVGVVAGAGPGEREALQTLVTLLLFVAVPLAVAVWGRVELGPAFRLRGAPWPAFAGALLMGVALVPPVFEALALLRRHGLTFLSAEQAQRLQALVREWRLLPAGLVAGAVALMGAAEEWFFRGYLFSALRRAGGVRAAVLGSGVLFGLFHAASALDRLLPSTALGLILGWVCWRSGSVLPGMLLHACYDAASVLLAYYLPGGESDTGLPLLWVAGGVVGAALGAALVALTRPPASEG